MTATSRLLLMSWFSPAYPVGAFAYSHGLEWAHEAGDLPDAAALRAWLADLLGHGAPRNDALLLAEAYRAASGEDGPRLAAAAELALAFSASTERRLETATQGLAFLAATRAAWPCATLDLLRSGAPGEISYPVAVGAAAAGHGVPLGEVLAAFAHGFTANLVSAAVRLGAVGQTDGQRVLAALLPDAEALASWAERATLDELGTCCFRSDISSLRHETQYSRLFRS